MNVIFLTISRISDISSRGIYTDLLRKFRNEGHNVYIVSPRERKFNVETGLVVQDGVTLLGVKTLNVQKTNIIEKGLGTLLLESQFERAINKYLKGISFDLILYSTPPITFTNVVKSLKKNNPQAVSYLLLKDIFPQNAVDLGMFSKKSLFYWYFRKKEIGLYKSSDYIGCMSPANVDFVLKHNSYVKKEIVEVAPNSIELVEDEIFSSSKSEIRSKYGLPIDKPIFIYGGNLGKPQGVSFLIECLDTNKHRNDCHFVVVGNGTEYKRLEQWFGENNPKSSTLLASLPKNDYDLLVKSCDVGLIFLDYRFTIPNYPSRLLSYLEYKMPIIAATDKNTDIGTIAEQNNYGFACSSNNVDSFTYCVDKYVANKKLIEEMGQNGYRFLNNNYLVENTYDKIIDKIK